LHFYQDGGGEDGGAEELEVANVGGVFVVLISGGGFAVIVSVMESLLEIRNRSKELGVSTATNQLLRLPIFLLLLLRFHSPRSCSMKFDSSSNAAETQRKFSVANQARRMADRWKTSRIRRP